MKKDSKVKYEKVVNYSLDTDDIEVVITTTYGKIAIIGFADGRGVGIPSNWIQQDTEGGMSFGVADSKEYLTYTDSKADDKKVLGKDLWAELTASGYKEYQFPPQTADEMIKLLFK